MAPKLDSVPLVTKTMTPEAEAVEQVRQGLLRDANASHAEYPQYANYWDDWSVVQVNKLICWKNYKRYPMLAEGDLVLGKVMSPQEAKESYLDEAKRWITLFVPNHPCGNGKGMNCLFELDRRFTIFGGAS